MELSCSVGSAAWCRQVNTDAMPTSNVSQACTQLDPFPVLSVLDKYNNLCDNSGMTVRVRLVIVEDNLKSTVTVGSCVVVGGQAQCADLPIRQTGSLHLEY